MDYIISPDGFTPIYESGIILLCGIESWLNQPIRNNETICYDIENKKSFTFYFDWKELVRFICKNKSLNKHKEQKCPAAYLVPCPRGEGSWKTSLKLRSSMRQRLYFRKEKLALGEMSFQLSSTLGQKKKGKNPRYFHVGERYLMTKSWGENKSVTMPFEDKHQPYDGVFVWKLTVERKTLVPSKRHRK